MFLTPAERLLQELGITEPKEIDVDAIAFHVGAHVQYRPLQGCEARIIGSDEKAIITIKASSHPRRKRFSIAHELGHWHHHRGECLVCRVQETWPGSLLSPERVADGFAADLLMPAYLFRPLARQHAKLNFSTVNVLSEIFTTSLTATAIRLVESDHTPSLLICHGPHGRKWFARAPSVPQKWFPRDDLDADSFAFGILFGGEADDPMPHRIGADAWFDRWDAERFLIQEQTCRSGPNETITLLLINDTKMLEDDGRI